MKLIIKKYRKEILWISILCCSCIFISQKILYNYQINQEIKELTKYHFSSEEIIGNKEEPRRYVGWDYNGDGTWEWTTITMDTDRKNLSWTCYIYFTKLLPILEIHNCYQISIIENKTDLDKDWAEELWILYNQFTSDRSTYQIRTLKNNQWKLLIPELPIHPETENCPYHEDLFCDYVTQLENGDLRTIQTKLDNEKGFIWEEKIIHLEK